MRTPPRFTFPTDAPVFILFRPWSHTNRRQMIEILDGPFPSIEEATKALPQQTPYALAQIGKLLPLGTFVEDIDWASKEGRAAAAQLIEAPPYISVSWSARSPDKLKGHSRPQISGTKAEDWADFCADLPEFAGRRFGILHAEGPIEATFSP